MRYLEHELIKKNTLEYREYQVESAEKAVDFNTLIVLPTGTGKTAIALIVSVEWLKNNAEAKILFMAPTRPLIQQHAEYFTRIMNINPMNIKILNGLISPEKRKELWNGKIIFATPQIVYNDLIRSYIIPKKNWLIIFDEAHRSVKEYHYVKVARIICDVSKSRILALTASPGDIKKTKEIMGNLCIEKLIVLTRSDKELRKYLQPVVSNIIEVIPSPPLKYALELIMKSIRVRINKIKDVFGDRPEFIIDMKTLSFTRLDKLREIVEEEYLKKKIDAMSRKKLRIWINELIYIERLLNYLETYSYKLFLNYFNKLKDKASKRRVVLEKSIVNDSFIQEAYIIIETLLKKGYTHPKIKKLIDFILKRREKTLVFVGIKDVTLEIVDKLNSLGIPTGYLIGQLKGKEKIGMRQREQIHALEKFRKGEYMVLVATHIGEEGLDISEVKNVIFYDNPISAIRRIQREGRTGRTEPGEIYFITLKNTRDETRYWIGKKMEKKFIDELKRLKPIFIPVNKKEMKPLTEFMKKKENLSGKVIVDYREKSGDIVNILKKRGVTIELKKLSVGDYIVGRYIIERKTMEDFAQSIIDGRIFSQLRELKNQAGESLLLLEGETYEFTKRLDLKSLVGVIVSIIEDYKIPIIRTLTDYETAEIIYRILNRQISDKRIYHKLRLEKKPLEIHEIQKFLVAGIPGIDSVIAHKLLSNFGTLEKIASASFEELIKVEGIGPKLAKKIYQVFHETYPGYDSSKLIS